MSLQITLITVVNHLLSGNLESEAQVKLAVILPVLRALGWNDADPKVFIPEYSVTQGFVDYALLNNGKPYVFIEAKRVGALGSEGEEQLFRYASNKGVPLLILTDGNRWDFYLSMAQGDPEDRRFYRLELQNEQKIPEYVKFLEKFLRKNRVVSGEAKRDAEKHHESNLVRERALEAIPEAWRALLEKPDDILCDLLEEKVESDCGSKPESDEVKKFLRKLAITPSLTETYPPTARQNPEYSTQQSKRSKVTGFVLFEDKYPTGSAKSTLSEILIIFERDKPGFMQQFAERTSTKKRNLVARNRTDLYQSPRLIEKHSVDLKNGWWLGSNLSKLQIEDRIKTACDIAGVKFGKQLKLIEQ